MMDRSETIDQERVVYWRTFFQHEPGYTEYGDPVPESVLKLDDDVMWAGLVLRVVWGTDDPNSFLAYNQDVFGDTVPSFDARQIEDRAPLDPEEEPMPIFPPPIVVEPHDPVPMARLVIDALLIGALHALAECTFPDFPEPVPGTLLKVFDDVRLWDAVSVRVLWGSDTPGHFLGYAPAGQFGASFALFPAAHVTDRAPLDPLETPMPIYPP
jgi:hypothetical protein